MCSTHNTMCSTSTEQSTSCKTTSPQPSTSGDQNAEYQPSCSSSQKWQMGSGGNHRELSYTLEPQKASDAPRFGLSGTDYKIHLIYANSRQYQQLVDEFRYGMNEIVDNLL